MHLGLGWTRSGPLIMELHCSREQWRHGEVQKGKEKGKGRWWGSCAPLFFNVNSGVSTVHVAEQWRHGAEGEGEGEEGEGLVIPLLQGAPLLLCCNTVATKAAPSCFEEGEGVVIPLLQGAPLFTVLQHGCNKSSPKLLLRLKPPGWKFF